MSGWQGPRKEPPLMRMPQHDELTLWLQRAKPGERIEYHRGLLMYDRCARPQTHREFVQACEADNAGYAAWYWYEAGAVDLVQQRIDERSCAYLAVRCGRLPTKAGRSALSGVAA